MDSWVAGNVDVVRNFGVVVFPPEYTGPVYIRFKAPSEPLEVVIRLVWGPWKLEQKVTVAPDGIALVFAKTRSGEGEPPLRVMADVAVGVAAHTGMPDDLPPGSVIDCNDGWVQ